MQIYVWYSGDILLKSWMLFLRDPVLWLDAVIIFIYMVSYLLYVWYFSQLYMLPETLISFYSLHSVVTPDLLAVVFLPTMYTCSLSAIWLIFIFLTLHHIPFYVCIPASFSSYHVILKESLMQRRLSVCCIFWGTHFLLQISTQRVPLSMTHIVNVQHFKFFSCLFFVFWFLIFVFWHSLEYCCYKKIHTNLHILGLVKVSAA